MQSLPKIAASFLFLLLAACASTRTRPSIHLQSADLTMELHRPALGITDMAISRDGTLLLTADTGGMGARKVNQDDYGSGMLRIWDLEHGTQLKGISIPDLQEIYSVNISPDKRYALAGGTNTYRNRSGLTLWEIATGNRVAAAPEIDGDVLSASFSPDGKTILAATSGSDAGRFGLTSPASDPAISLFDTATGKELRQFRTQYESRSMTAAGSLKFVTATFSPDGRQILSGGFDGVLRLWDAQTGEQLRTMTGHNTRFDDRFGITGLAFASDGKTALTTAEHDSAARLWDIATGRQVRQLDGLNVYGMGFLAAWGATFSPDDHRTLLAALPLGIWDVASGKQTVPLQMNRTQNVYIIQNTKSMSALYHPKQDAVFVHANDGSIRLFDAATGREKVMLVGFDDGEWIILTSEGYYNASPNGARYLTANLGGSDYSVEMFYDVFYRPDIVMATLRGEDTHDLVTLTMHDAVKNPPPVVAFTSAPTATGTATAKVCYQVQSSGGGIGEVRLFHNGKLIQSDGYYREMAKSSSEKPLLAMNSQSIYNNMRSVKVVGTAEPAPSTSRSKGEVFEDCREIDVIPGENEVSVTAFNRSNTVQGYMQSVTFNSQTSPEDPQLYILAVGIDQYRDSSVSLKYAAKDAQDLEETLRKQAATIYQPQNIHYQLLQDAAATKAAITARIGELARTIKPGDSFILFVAGHGVLVQNQYYLLTHDFAGSLEPGVALSSNEIVEISKQIPALSQLMIFDTCHAGGVDTIVSGLYDARMSVLAKKMGLHIYASASSKEAAQDGYQGNGLFTHALLDGLHDPAADKNRDHLVSLVELGDFARDETATISKQDHRDQTPLIINFGRDNPIYQLR